MLAGEEEEEEEEEESLEGAEAELGNEDRYY
jgi:hypothetical protein